MIKACNMGSIFINKSCVSLPWHQNFLAVPLWSSHTEAYVGHASPRKKCAVKIKKQKNDARVIIMFILAITENCCNALR